MDFWVDKVEMVVFVHHFCCLLHLKVYVALKVRLLPKEILCQYLLNEISEIAGTLFQKLGAAFQGIHQKCAEV